MKQIRKDNFVAQTTVDLFFQPLMNSDHLVAKTNAVKRNVGTAILIKLENNAMDNLNVMKIVKSNILDILAQTKTDATLPVETDSNLLMKFATP